MNVQPGSPVPSPGSQSVPNSKTPPAQAKSLEEQLISKKLLDSMNKLYQVPKSPAIQAKPLKSITEVKKAQIADKITQIAIDNGISSFEIQDLLDNDVLDLQTFIDNELLLDTYERNISGALQNLQFTGAMGMPGISRESVIKVVTAAFKAEVMHGKGAVIPTPSGDFLVRLKEQEAYVYAIPISSLQQIGKGSFSVAYKVHEIVSLDPIIFKAVEPKDPTHRERTIGEVYHEVKILKEAHANGYQPGLKPAPHAVVGIVGGKTSTGPNAAQGAQKIGVLEDAYEGNLFELINNQWFNDWTNGIYHMDERIDMCERLLNGLAALHDIDRSHGDLKLLNVLYKTENSKVIADISDFGTSLSETEAKEKLDDPAKFPKFEKQPWGANTSAYVAQGDCYKEVDAVTNHDPHKLIEIQKSRDVFSLGIALVNILTGIPGYGTVKKQGINFADLSNRQYADAFDLVFDDATRDTLITLFDSVLNPNWKVRCTAEYARGAFEYFKANYPFTVK